MSFRPRSNVRRKQRVAVESEDDDEIDISKQIAKAKKKTAPAPTARAPTKLSFGDDDDDETSIVLKKKKKKNKSRGVSALDLDGPEAQAAVSSYSASTLADLKEQTPQMPSKFASGAPGQNTDGMWVVQVHEVSLINHWWSLCYMLHRSCSVQDVRYISSKGYRGIPRISYARFFQGVGDAIREA